MIDTTTLKSLHRQVNELLVSYRLTEALDGIGIVTRECRSRALQDELDSLTTNYDQMLDFLDKGGTDNNRNEMQDKMLRNAFKILNNAARIIRIKRQEDIYSKAYKRVVDETNSDNIIPSLGGDEGSYNKCREALLSRWDDQQGMAERFDTQDLIFDLLWTAPIWDIKTTAYWYEFICRQNDLVQQHLIGGVFMSLWEYFDHEKIIFLRLMIEADNHETSMTAMVLLVIALLRYENEARISLPQNYFLEIKKLQAVAQRVQISLILQNESTKANDEIRQLMSNLNPNAPDFQEQTDRIGKKILEQIRKGYDTSLDKIPLVHSSKFLRRISHWWMPYDESHPFIQHLFIKSDGEMARGISYFMNHNLECSVTKYSLCELIQNIKSLDQLNDRFAQIPKYERPEDFDTPKINTFVIYFIQNLFRFFYHSPLVQETENPFLGNIYLSDNYFLHGFITPSCMKILCELLTREKHTDVALRYLTEYIHTQEASADIFKMMGQCYLDKDNPKKAVQMLSQADLLQGEEIDDWILRTMADCYGRMNNLKEQAEVLARLEALHPDDAQYSLQLAICLIEDTQYDEAMKKLYRLNYADPDNPEVMMLIVDCATRQQNPKTAKKYLKKRLKCEVPLTVSDHLRAGMFHFLNNQWDLAVRHYTQSGRDAFVSQWPLLLRLGATQKDCYLMLDMIMRHNHLLPLNS